MLTVIGVYLPSKLCLIVSFFLVTMVPATSTEYTHNDVSFKNFVENLDDIESKLGKPLLSKDKNSVVCVSSLQIVLGLVYAGAQGKTASELEALFGVGSNQTETLSKFKKFVSYLEVPETKIANAMYVEKHFNLKKEFVTKGQQYFNVTVSPIDFKQKQEAASTINAWAEEKTEHLIKNLIQPDELSDDTKLVLLNAIYFKGQWKYRFEPKNTKDGDFQVSASKKITVKQMTRTAKFDYAIDENYEYLSMPYSDERISMLIILPKDIQTFQKKDISKAKINSLKFEKLLIEVVMPKFKVESTINWVEILRSKIPSIFDSSANLKGIADGPPLYVSMLKQKAYIKVDEVGTEAAAVTVGSITAASAEQPPKPKKFIVDRPFYYMIQVKTVLDLYMHLFQGAVIEPQAET